MKKKNDKCPHCHGSIAEVWFNCIWSTEVSPARIEAHCLHCEQNITDYIEKLNEERGISVKQKEVKMKKRYCFNCKFFSFHVFRGFSTENCIHLLNIKKDYAGRTIYISAPIILNKKNNCKLYKRQWWKFWVKEVI